MASLRHNPIVVCIHDTEAAPEYSIVMPIHNQEPIIKNILANVLLHTRGLYELILIFDGCTDNSKSVIADIVPPENMTRLLVITNTFGLFETSADNQGFMASRGTYIVEIQADMMMETPGYNELLCKPLRQFGDLIAISGRCCHQMNNHDSGVGKKGHTVEQPHTTPIGGSTIFLSHTVNRGPLALRRSMLVELNYLDEEHYVQDDDDHDLFARAWTQHGWRTAFYPVEFYAPLHWGSNRKPRPLHVSEYLARRREKSGGGFLNKNRFNIQYPNDETRSLR